MRIVFACTANQCRSPLAEYLCRGLLDGHDLGDVEVTSLGVFAASGVPAVDAAVRAPHRAGVDIRGHRARSLADVELGPGDRVYVMEERHRQRILEEATLTSDAVMLLGELAANGAPEIEDPIGGPDAAFDRCIARMLPCLRAIVTRVEEDRLARS